MFIRFQGAARASRGLTDSGSIGTKVKRLTIEMVSVHEASGFVDDGLDRGQDVDGILWHRLTLID